MGKVILKKETTGGNIESEEKGGAPRRQTRSSGSAG